jgi:stage V sporulation protein G
MKHKISEIQIVPVKPKDGLVAFANFVLDGNIYLGSIGIMTKLNGGFRLVYPAKKIGNRNINLFHPINKEFGQFIEIEVLKHFEKVMKAYDRYNSFNS